MPVTQWRAFDARGKRIWDVSLRTFFAGPMSNPWSLAKRMRSPFDLKRDPSDAVVAPFRRTHFDDPRLIQWADRYATYSGSSPYSAPATLAYIPHIEARYGCWYPMGGLDALRAAFERVAIDVGVEIRTATEVTAIPSTDRVTGVGLADGTTDPADIVVANTDAEHLYADLLPDPDALAPSAAGKAIDERVRAVRRGAGTDAERRPTTTCGSPRATGPSTTSWTRAGSPTTRRSMRACRR